MSPGIKSFPRRKKKSPNPSNIFANRRSHGRKAIFFASQLRKMSSDSSDEENLDLLREAQDTQFIKDHMFSDKPEKSAIEAPDNRERLPSQRKVDDTDAQFNFLKVTPEFRNHVARKLSEILDAKLNKSLVNVEADETPKKKRAKGGVKLLSDSSHFLKASKVDDIVTSEVVEAINLNQVPRYKKLKVEVPEESLKEVAVSPEDILSKKEVKTWSNRSRAPVFQYKKAKNGQLELVE